MSGTVPVKKVDKNGKLVTRHVKPAKAGDAAWTQTLPVVPPVANERERIIRACGDFLLDGWNEISLSSLSDKELSDLDAIVSKIDLDSDFKVMRELFNPTKNAPNSDPMMWPELKYDLDYIARYNRLSEGVQLKTSLPLIRGIQAYEHRSVPRKAHQALMDVSVAAIEVIGTFKDGFVYPKVSSNMPTDLDNYWSFFEDDGEVTMRWMRNQKFISLVCRRVDEADEIVRIMKERNTIRPETIEGILDTDSHSSLKAGVL